MCTSKVLDILVSWQGLDEVHDVFCKHIQKDGNLLNMQDTRLSLPGLNNYGDLVHHYNTYLIKRACL